MLFQRLDWHDDAICQDIEDPDLFFPERGRPTKVAKALCACCPVRETCLEFALMTLHPSEDYGVWGGTSEIERQRLRRERGIVWIDRRIRRETVSPMLYD